jgi:hypothetical protein
MLTNCTAIERKVASEYNRRFVRLGWLPLSKFSEGFREAVMLHSLAQWITIFDDVAALPRDAWPKSRTFVRLAWDDYEGKMP